MTTTGFSTCGFSGSGFPDDGSAVAPEGSETGFQDDGFRDVHLG